jgi:hypothetical protein
MRLQRRPGRDDKRGRAPAPAGLPGCWLQPSSQGRESRPQSVPGAPARRVLTWRRARPGGGRCQLQKVTCLGREFTVAKARVPLDQERVLGLEGSDPTAEERDALPARRRARACLTPNERQPGSRIMILPFGSGVPGPRQPPLGPEWDRSTMGRPDRTRQSLHAGIHTHTGSHIYIHTHTAR